MTFTAPTDDSLETTAQIRTDKLGPQPCPRRRRRPRASATILKAGFMACRFFIVGVIRLVVQRTPKIFVELYARG